MKDVLIIVVGTLLLTIVWGGWAVYDSLHAGGEEAVVCTADAMQCPDGSFVGRTGPNCEFVCPSE